MILKDFLFSYNAALKNDLNKKKYFKCLRRLFYYPYKYILDKFRQLFKIRKLNLDENFKHEKLNNIDLDSLFIRFNCDKGSNFVINDKKVKGHNYTPYYEKYFSKFKDYKELNILEIGSLRGSGAASFYYYLNKPKIICADINPFQIQIFSNNIRNCYVDTQSKDVLSNLNSYINKNFDIIIDDGSHNIRDQIITMNIFFKKLNNGGIYVIEDSSQYLSYKHLNKDNLKYGSKEILTSIKKNLSIEKNYLTTEEVESLRAQIKNLYFEKGDYIENNVNISEILFIEKN